MAWDTYARTDLAADDSMETSKATWLADRVRYLGERPIQFYQADATTTSATYASLFTFLLRVPDYASAWYLHFYPESYVTAGTGNIRITATNNGADSADITNTGSHADGPEISVLIDSTEINTEVTFTVEGKVTGGNTLHVRSGTNVDTATRHPLWFEAVI